MTTPRVLLFIFFALTLSFSAVFSPVRAQDAPAKEEAPKDEPPKEEPPKEEPPKAEAPKEEESAGLGEAKPIARSKKKGAAKKKPYDYDRSKYKSKEPSQTSVYRFTEKGEPIKNEARKPAPKKKKRSEPPDGELKERADSCGSEGTCAEKKSEADAL